MIPSFNTAKASCSLRLAKIKGFSSGLQRYQHVLRIRGAQEPPAVAVTHLNAVGSIDFRASRRQTASDFPITGFCSSDKGSAAQVFTTAAGCRKGGCFRPSH